MLFTFCNGRFGAPYRETVRAFATGKVPVTLVQSRRGERPAGWYGPVWQKRLTLQGLLETEHRRSTHVLHVEDVNARRFWRKVRWLDLGVIAGFDQAFEPHTIGRFDALIEFRPTSRGVTVQETRGLIVTHEREHIGDGTAVLREWLERWWSGS